MRADAHRDRRRDEVALVVGQPEREPVGLLAAHGLGHGPEVAQRARREVVALGRVHVEVVERLEVGRHRLVGRAGDHDARLVGLLDVAPPLLVHAGKDIGLGQWGALGARERYLEVVARLPGREAALLAALEPPSELVQLRHHARAHRLAVGGGQVVEAPYVGVGDALLDRRGRPPAGDDGRSHPDGERAVGLEVLGHRAQPGVEVVGRPVDDRTLGQVGQGAVDAHLRHRDRPVQHQPGADQVVAREPPQRLRPPLRLHPRPGRRLQEARGSLGAHERQVLLRRDGPDARVARHLTRLSTQPSGAAIASCSDGAREPASRPRAISQPATERRSEGRDVGRPNAAKHVTARR